MYLSYGKIPRVVQIFKYTLTRLVELAVYKSWLAGPLYIQRNPLVNLTISSYSNLPTQKTCKIVISLIDDSVNELPSLTQFRLVTISYVIF